MLNIIHISSYIIHDILEHFEVTNLLQNFKDREKARHLRDILKCLQILSFDH